MTVNDEMDSTWNQMQRNVKANGFREGASKGNEEGMASGFDDGFAEGLRLGKAIGADYGRIQVQRYLSQVKDATKLENAQAHCEICVRQPSTRGKSAMPDSIQQLSYEELTALQVSRTDHLLKQFEGQQDQHPSGTQGS